METTFADDLQHVNQCLVALPTLLAQLQRRIDNRQALQSINKQYVKLKFNNFISTTVEQVSSTPDLAGYEELVRTGFERGGLPVRLIGIGVRLRSNSAAATQLELPLHLY